MEQCHKIDTNKVVQIIRKGYVIGDIFRKTFKIHKSIHLKVLLYTVLHITTNHAYGFFWEMIRVNKPSMTDIPTGLCH